MHIKIIVKFKIAKNSIIFEKHKLNPSALVNIKRFILI